MMHGLLLGIRRRLRQQATATSTGPFLPCLSFAHRNRAMLTCCMWVAALVICAGCNDQ